MNECNSIEIDITNLIDQTKFRLDEITKIKNYFLSNKLNKENHSVKN